MGRKKLIEEKIDIYIDPLHLSRKCMIDQGPPSKSITADHGLEKEKENVRKISYVIRDLPLELHISGLWQYGAWCFQTGGTKLEISTYSKEIIEF